MTPFSTLMACGFRLAQAQRPARRVEAGAAEPQGPEYLAPTHDRPRYLIRIVPTKMLSWDGIEWARKYTEK